MPERKHATRMHCESAGMPMPIVRNRAPQWIPHSQEQSILRRPTMHLAFGYNPSRSKHACMGAVLSILDAGKKEGPMSNFWDIVWLILSTFVFISYLFVLFHIVLDLFRDTELGGGFKALWIVGLVFVPLFTALFYILGRGRGMAARQVAAVQRAKSETDAYIREVAAKSPADQIADAKRLLDAGTINADEFGRLKAKALA